jgi:integrase
MDASAPKTEPKDPWNKGRLIGQKQPLKLKEIWAIRIRLQLAMRRTKVTLIYTRTKNLRAIQLLLGHTKLESTVRYLGIETDDALEIAEQTEV